MEYKELSVKGIKVSRVGLGTWAMGGQRWGGTDEKEAIETVQHAVDTGINLIDTAPVYGLGLSEEMIGKALLQEGRRSKAIIATKLGLAWDAEENITRDCSLNQMRKELEASLKRLRTDYIDIYQIHWPDPKVSFAETAELMNTFTKEGKILAIGVSNFSTSQMQEWMKYAPIHTVQPPLNLFERDAEKDIIPFALENNSSILAYGSLCRWLLSGKYSMNTTFGPGDMRGPDAEGGDPKFNRENFPKYLSAVSELNDLAAKYGKTVAHLAVRWVLDKGITSALWGARKISQLNLFDGVSGWEISESDMTVIDQILLKNIPVPISPEFMAPPL